MSFLPALLIFGFPLFGFYWSWRKEKRRQLLLRKELIQAYVAATYTNDVRKIEQAAKAYVGACSYSESERKMWLEQLITNPKSYRKMVNP